MKVWLVYVKHFQNSGYYSRYLDTMWASEEHAAARVAELSDSIKTAGCWSTSNGFIVVSIVGRMADASVQSESKSQGVSA